MIFCGIDPGVRGAIALYDPTQDWLELHDCPTLDIKGKRVMFLPELIDILKSVEVASCAIEKSQAMPQQGVSSTFSYGVGYGSYLGVLAGLGIAYTRITPQEWKKKLRVPSDKDGARARASELLPAHTGQWLKKGQHGRAEAALLAYYEAHHGQL